MMFVCTTQGCISDDDPKGEALKVGDTIPEFTVDLSDGSTVSSESMRGKTGVIVFFHTDCVDCREELPVVQKLWEAYKENPDVVFAVIARQESQEQIAKYWEENGLTMPYSPQDTKDVYLLFAPSVIPRIFITNPKGVITFTSGDTDMPSLELLKEAVESASRL